MQRRQLQDYNLKIAVTCVHCMRQPRRPISVRNDNSEPIDNVNYCGFGRRDTIPVNALDSKGNYSDTLNNTKLVHWPLMGGLLHLVQRGGAWAGWGPA